MTFIRDQFKAFLAALGFLTWLPLPRFTCAPQHLRAMNVYLPLVGGIIGAITAAVLAGSAILFPWPVAVALGLAGQLALTGAFHEDGVADIADSLGAMERQRALEILRDSRIGTYGTVALVTVLLLKFASLTAIEPGQAVRGVIAYAAASRWAGVLLLTISRPLGDPGGLGHTVRFQGCWGRLIVGAALAAGLAWFVNPPILHFIPFAVITVTVLVQRFCYRKYGGVNGDAAGCAAVLTETTLYILASSEAQ